MRLNDSFCLCVWHSKEPGLSAEICGINWECLFQTANQYFRNASLKGSDEKKIWKNTGWIIVFRDFCLLQMQWFGNKMIIFSPLKYYSGRVLAGHCQFTGEVMEKEPEMCLEEWQALCLAHSSVPLNFSQVLPRGYVALWGCACKMHLHFIS